MCSLLERRTQHQENMQAESDNINPQLSAEYINQWNGTTQRIVNIDITKIQPYTTPDGKEQPYKIKQDKIERLSISINDLGILQPIIVRKKNKDYEILAGHHRYYAAKMCGLTTIPCQIKDNIDDFTAYMVVAESNTRTDEVLPSENAQIFKTYMDKRGSENEAATLNEISDKFGVSSTTVYRYVHLLKLNPKLIPMVDSKIIPFGRFEMLIAHLTDEAQVALADYIEMYDVHSFSGRNIADLCAYFDKHGAVSIAEIYEICNNNKPKEKKRDTSQGNIYEKISGMFPALHNLTEADMDDLIVKLLSSYFNS